MLNIELNKKEEWIIKNIRDDLNSLSPFVTDFCEEFNLKVKWSGLFETNSTFTKTLKSLKDKGVLKRAYSVKVDRGWGMKGGNLICYGYTEDGYSIQNRLITV